MKYYVYKITNKKNGKLYIGKTDDIKRRWKAHVNLSKHPKLKNHEIIHAAIRKHGTRSFTLEIIEIYTSEKKTLKREMYWIAFYKTNVRRYGRDAGYNQTDGGEGISGFKHSAATKAKIGRANKGRKAHNFGQKPTKATIRSISKAVKAYYAIHPNPMTGRKHSKKTKKMWSIKRKGLTKGSDIASSKLIENQVKHIKRLLKQNKLTNAKIGEMFSVTGECISAIRCGKTWRHV